MKEFGDDTSHVRDLDPRRATAPLPVRPLFTEDHPGRSRYVTLAMIATAAIGVLALLAYEVWFAPDDAPPWTPPKGLAAADTPDWLQTLCADHTRELCAAADRARTAQDCDAMRAALESVAAIEKRLTAAGKLNTRQHWVLVELYDQGRELCQFERAK